MRIFSVFCKIALFAKLFIQPCADIVQSAVNDFILHFGDVKNIYRETAVPIKLYIVTVLGELEVEKGINYYGCYACFSSIFRENIMKRIETVKRFKIIKRDL